MAVVLNPYIRTLHSCVCGWKRTITDLGAWRQRLIDHPIYGEQTNMNCAMRDVDSHNCMTYLQAIERLEKRRKNVPQPKAS